MVPLTLFMASSISSDVRPLDSKKEMRLARVACWTLGSFKNRTASSMASSRFLDPEEEGDVEVAATGAAGAVVLAMVVVVVDDIVLTGYAVSD
jgi:hypothetical protein